MAELLPENLEATNSTDDDHTTNAKCKHQEVTQIMDWIQSFSSYITVVSRAKPDRVVYLIVYLNPIINGQKQFQTLTGHHTTASSDKKMLQPPRYNGAPPKAHCEICHASTTTPDHPQVHWHFHPPPQPRKCLYACSGMKIPYKDFAI